MNRFFETDAQASFAAWLSGLGGAPWLSSTPVAYDPTRGTAETDEILVGLGRPSGRLDPAAPGGLAITQKGADCASVAAFVASRDEATVASWRARFRPEPGRPFGPARLVVEDASPDTCMGLILLAARLAGVPADGLPARWVDYTSLWETGDLAATGEFMQSWGALHSALVHALFGPAPAGQIGAALESGLAYLAGLLRLDAEPGALPAVLPLDLHRRARQYAERELRDYRDSLALAERLQLSLPVAGQAHRRLVDAVFETETMPSGARRQLLRADGDSPLGTGYVLWALHRPDQAGSGYDMTVSIDPTSDLTLRPLWQVLEAEEDRRWQGLRPRDASRPIASYPDGGGPNEPWWDNHGTYTLVGAPKRVTVDGAAVPGSRLRWGDVLELTWQAFHPAIDVRVLQPGGMAPQPLLRIPRQDLAATGKRLARAVRDPAGSAVRWTPTLQREIAAWLGSPTTDVPLLRALPPADQLDLMVQSGGSVLLCADGVLLLAHDPLDDGWLTAATATVGQVAQQFAAARRLHDDLAALTQAAMGADASRPRRLMAHVRRLGQIQQEAHAALHRTAPDWTDAEARLLAERLEQAWGLSERLVTLVEQAKEQEALLLSLSRLHTEWLIQALTLFGFPFALFSQFFAYSVAGIGTAGAGGVNWLGLGLYFGCSLLLTLVLWLVLKWNRRTKADKGQ